MNAVTHCRLMMPIPLGVRVCGCAPEQAPECARTKPPAYSRTRRASRPAQTERLPTRVAQRVSVRHVPVAGRVLDAPVPHPLRIALSHRIFYPVQSVPPEPAGRFVSLLGPRGPRSIFFFFNDTATTEIYTLSLHDALPI